MPLFTIVTATLNRDKYVAPCLDSVAKQTFRSFEQIIIDGDSTDATPRIIQDYISRHPDIRITFVKSPANGVYDAFNQALDLATGKFINFLNSDDYYVDENTLQIVADSIQKNTQAQWIQSRYRTLDIAGKVHKFESVNLAHNPMRSLFRTRYMIFGKPVSHQAQFVAQRVYKELGNFDLKYKYVADYDFMFRMIHNHVFPTILEEPLAVIRQHGESLTTGGLSSYRQYLPEARRMFRHWRMKKKQESPPYGG